MSLPQLMPLDPIKIPTNQTWSRLIQSKSRYLAPDPDPSSRTLNMHIIIVGAGPAGLAAARRLLDCGAGPHSVLVLEAGKCVFERINMHCQTLAMLNGVGGAGLYSDRKFSALPAGTGLLSQNPYELRESFGHILDRLRDALPDHQDQIETLRQSVLTHLGDQTRPSEQIERDAASWSAKPDSMTLRESSQTGQGGLKLYPSLVLKDFLDAIKVIDAFVDGFTVPVVCDAVVKDVAELCEPASRKCTVTYETKDCLGQHRLETLQADYVLMATGRFGPWSWPPSLPPLCPGRLEVGVRVELASCPALLERLLSCGVADPKYCVESTVTVDNEDVPCQLRTFCVCTTGYMAYCHDTVTGCRAVSASSSISEQQLRIEPDDECDNTLHAGASVGIMVRWTDPSFVERWRDAVKQACMAPPQCLTLDLTSLSDSPDLPFPPALCRAVKQGVTRMLHHILGDAAMPHQVCVRAPCLEGTGAYPGYDGHGSHHTQVTDRVFVAGDLGGQSRGLLQALVDGDMAAKRILCHNLDTELHAQQLLQPYQSIYLPGHAYNKTLVLDRRGDCPGRGMPTTNWSEVYARMLQSCHVYLENCAVADTPQATCATADMAKMSADMHRVRHTGAYGVLYELHHFFLDDAALLATRGLHVITEKTLLQYMLACNAVESCLAQLAKSAMQLAGIEEGRCPESVFWDRQFKACVLALRTRPAVAQGDNYTDVPIMQSAYKLLPTGVTSEEGVRLVAATAALLNGCFKALASEHGLHFSLHRTKIETQEPGVESLQGQPPYLECHVKLNMMKANGSDGTGCVKLPYMVKKRAIQAIARLFEGEGAPRAGIFRVLSVSINLLKHPQRGQQFFLTFRTDAKPDMRTLRHYFSSLVDEAVAASAAATDLQNLDVMCITDAEFVVYDDKRDMDAGWFPVTQDFLEPNYRNRMAQFITIGNW